MPIKIIVYSLLTGYLVLIVAIALNAIAIKFKIKTWYDFLTIKSPTTKLSLFWLFIVYPLAIGLAVNFAFTVLELV